TGIFSLQPSVMVLTNPPSAYGLTPNRLPVSSYSAKARLLIPTDSGMIASGPASATRPRSEREQRPQCLEGIRERQTANKRKGYRWPPPLLHLPSGILLETHTE